MRRVAAAAVQIARVILWPRLSVVIPFAVAISMLTCFIWAIASLKGTEVAIEKSWLNVVVFGIASYWTFTVLLRWVAYAIQALRKIRMTTAGRGPDASR